MSDEFKVVDRNHGNIIGILRVPDSCAKQMRERGMSVMCVTKPIHVSLGPSVTPAMPIATTLRTFAIGLSHRVMDAVELIDITPEEIEAVDGFWFYPGTGYLKSLVKGGGAA